MDRLADDRRRAHGSAIEAASAIGTFDVDDDVFAKLALRDRAEAVVWAYESGLVTAGDARRG